MDFSVTEGPTTVEEKVLLWHAVSLFSLHQAGLVVVQNSERRVVLERRDECGAKIVLLVQKPDHC